LTPQDLETALQYFETALQIDPNYALAYTGVAMVWVVRGQFGLAPFNEAQSLGKAAAEKALELDNTLAEAHYAFAFVAWREWDWESAETSLQRGITDVLAARYQKSGKWVFPAYGIAYRYLDAGDYDRAIDWLEKGYEEHDPSLCYIGTPIWDPFRSYSRFQDLLRKIGLPVEEKK
jgi:tetratricopeptide (TPR) repeat protein